MPLESDLEETTVLPDYFLFITKELLDSDTNTSIEAMPLQLGKSVFPDLLSEHLETASIKSEDDAEPQTKPHFLLPANYKLSTKELASKQDTIKTEDGLGRPKPYFPTTIVSSAMRIQSRASSVSSTGRDILKQPPLNTKRSADLKSKRSSLELNPQRASFELSSKQSSSNLRNSLPPSESRSSTPAEAPAASALDSKEKEALQHIILASLRLRGISRSGDTSEMYKEVYTYTFQAARFALRLQKDRLKKEGKVGRIGMMDMQDKVDKLLNMFVGEEGVNSAEGF